MKFVSGIALFLMMTATSAAWAGSWANRPSWDQPDRPSARRTQSSRDAQDSSRSDLAPFAPGSNNLALDVGQVFLMGDLSSHYQDAIGMQAHYTYGVSDIFGFDSSLGYSNHSDGAFSMTTLQTGLRTNLAWYDKVVPYMVFGLGFYKPSYTFNDGQTSSSISPVLFGLHLGPGVDLQLTNQLFFGASLTFHDMFGQKKVDPNGKLFDVSGTFTSFFVHAGVTF